MNNDILIPPESAVHALRRNDPANTRIDIRLHLELRSDSALARALLENEHVTDVLLAFGLIFRRESSIPANRWSALRDILRSKPSLKLIVCNTQRSAEEDEEQQLSPQTKVVLKLFFDAIQRNNSVEKIQLYGPMPAGGEEVVAMLDNMVGLKLFGFHCTIMEDERRSKKEAVGAITSAILRNDAIEDLIFDDRETDMLPILHGLAHNNKRMPRLALSLENGGNNALYLEAVSKFQNGGKLMISLLHESCFQAVLQALPRLRARNVVLVFFEPMTFQTERRLPRLLQALQRNFSLFSVQAINDREIFWAAEDVEPVRVMDAADSTMVYQFWRCLRRNKRLADWTQNPELVPQSLWPEALSLAQQAGRDALFQSLQTVLGKDYAKPSSERKRKRTES